MSVTGSTRMLLLQLLFFVTDGGPTNVRVENKSLTGFRLAWDLPEAESCYGAAEIIIFLTFKVIVK